MSEKTVPHHGSGALIVAALIGAVATFVVGYFDTYKNASQLQRVNLDLQKEQQENARLRMQIEQLQHASEPQANSDNDLRTTISKLQAEVDDLRTKLQVKENELLSLRKSKERQSVTEHHGVEIVSSSDQPKEASAPIFETTRYKLTVTSLRVQGKFVELELLVENRSRFFNRLWGGYLPPLGSVRRESTWHLLDDRGVQWEMESDSDHFSTDGFSLPPGAKRKTTFTFAREEESNPKEFTLVGLVRSTTQSEPVDSRQFSIAGLRVSKENQQ